MESDTRGTIEIDDYLTTLWEDLVLYTQQAKLSGIIFDPYDVYLIMRASFIRRGVTPVPMFTDFLEAVSREG